MTKILNTVPRDIRDALSSLALAEDKLESARNQLNFHIVDLAFVISRHFQDNQITI